MWHWNWDEVKKWAGRFWDEFLFRKKINVQWLGRARKLIFRISRFLFCFPTSKSLLVVHVLAFFNSIFSHNRFFFYKYNSVSDNDTTFYWCSRKTQVPVLLLFVHEETKTDFLLFTKFLSRSFPFFSYRMRKKKYRRRWEWWAWLWKGDIRFRIWYNERWNFMQTTLHIAFPSSFFFFLREITDDLQRRSIALANFSLFSLYFARDSFVFFLGLLSTRFCTPCVAEEDQSPATSPKLFRLHRVNALRWQ